MILREKVAVVTGASSGVGRAIATAFRAEGALLAVCARRMARLQEAFGSDAGVFCQAVDVSDTGQIGAFVEAVYARYGRIDILVNNAGVLVRGTSAEVSLFDWRRSFAVNVDAPFAFCKLVLPIMREHNYGRIINVSSGSSVECERGYVAYSPSKAALNALTLSLAREMEGYDIKVNAMSPGMCRTEMAPHAPLKPEAAVPTALFLAGLPTDGPSGRFFWMMQELAVIPNLSHVNWLAPDVAQDLRSTD